MTESTATTARELGVDAMTALARQAFARSGMPDARILQMDLLDGGSRRNVVARAFVEGVDAHASVIVKAPCDLETAAPRSGAQSGSDAPYRTGFVREWIALRLMDDRGHASRQAARLVASDVDVGVMLLRDAGDGDTLVEALTGHDPAGAERAIVDLATALGTLHADTLDCAAELDALCTDAFPNRPSGTRPSLPSFERAARMLVDRLGGEMPGRELAELAARWDAPGRWSALMHGDPCPDNALRVSDDRVELIDFEWSGSGHALSDVVWWHMGFPSCWCAGQLPPATIVRADEAYRQAVSSGIPESTDDTRWSDELARLSTLQLLASAPRVLESALDEDEPWGTARHRERLLHWLQTCAAKLDERAILPDFRRAIDVWRTSIESRETHGESLHRYRAFRTAPSSTGGGLAMAIVVRNGLVLVQERWRRGTGFVHEFPGGRVDPEESAVQAAARELREETGLEESNVVHRAVARSRTGGAIAFIVFDSSSAAAPERTVRSRHQTFSWFAPGDIPTDDFEPADARFVRLELPAVVERLARH